MRVMHLLAELKPSGVERMLESAAPYLSAAGMNTIVVGQGAVHPYAPPLEAAGLDVRTVPDLRTAAGRRSWEALLREIDPDVVHVQTERGWAASALSTARTAPRARIVRSVHNVFQPTGRAKASRWLQSRIADRHAAAFLAATNHAALNERRMLGRTVEVVPNWVDDRFFRLREARRAALAEPDPPSTVIVGNSSAIKNQIVGLRAVERAGLDLYFHGDEQHATSEEVAILERLQNAGRLRSRGTGDTAPSLLRASVMLMPSLRESMSIALAEAIVTGVPVILNRAPGQEWAYPHPAVTALENVQADWDRALADLGEPEPPREHGDFERALSAEAGVARLEEVYRRVMRSR